MGKTDLLHRGFCWLLLCDGALLRSGVLHDVEFVGRERRGHEDRQQDAAQRIFQLHGYFLLRF